MRKHTVGDFIGIAIYVALFWIILSFIYGPGSKETIGYTLILALFFDILNEIHEELQKRA